MLDQLGGSTLVSLGGHTWVCGAKTAIKTNRHRHRYYSQVATTQSVRVFYFRIVCVCGCGDHRFVLNQNIIYKPRENLLVLKVKVLYLKLYIVKSKH